MSTTLSRSYIETLALSFLSAVVLAGFFQGPAAAQTTNFFGTFDDFGEAIEVTDDLDMLGQRELLVANPGNGSNVFGRVHILSPETGGTVAIISDPTANVAGFFGRALEDMGDIDNDPGNISDFAIGIPGANFGNGQVTIRRGNAPVIGSTIRNINNPGTAPFFGTSLANVGDLNNDGINELAVGAPAGFGLGDGQVHVFDGASGTRLFTINSPPSPIPGTDGISFGQTLAHLGNGVLAVGAPSATSQGNAQAGRVVLFQLTAGNATVIWERTLGFAFNRFGAGVASAGDVNGDSLVDVAISVPASGPAGSNGPVVVVISGNPAMIMNPLVTFNLPSTAAPFPMRVANIGDVDGDGLDDIATSDGDDAFVFGMSTPALPLATIAGTSAGIIGGWRGDLVAGDVLGLGTLTLVAGAPRHPTGLQRGLVRIQPDCGNEIHWHRLLCYRTATSTRWYLESIARWNVRV